MKFTAAGDALIQHRIYSDYKGFSDIGAYIARGDARFFNFESTLSREGECFASQFAGGTYLRCDPEVFDDVLKFGFNSTTFNNNHAMDYSYDGFRITLDYIDKSGVVQSGVGNNLAEASAPAFLDTKGGRVAFISLNSTVEGPMMAGEQSRRVKGRPGINVLRYNEKLVVSAEDFEKIVEIGERTGINVQKNIERAEGYWTAPPEGGYMLGNIYFERGENVGRVTYCDKRDLERVKKAIFEAKLQADYIIVSVHSHELAGTSKETPADFLIEFAHFCIDEGANAVVGHGPHLLRPIEVYKKRPIFYSLGDFVLQLYSVELGPEDFFATQGLTSDSTIHELIAKRSKNFTRGLMADKKMNEAVIPYWESDENGDLSYLELLPINLHMNSNKSDEGLPYIGGDTSFMGRLAEMSKPYGVDIEMSGGVGICKW